VAIVNGGGSIAEGNTSTTVSVTVNGDRTSETNETFFINLSNATNAVIGDGQGLGTIVDDDAVAIPIPTAGQVIINEALVSFASGTPTRNDFVELYNTTNQTLDISGLVVSYRTGSNTTAGTLTLPGAVGSGTTTIGANGYFLIVAGTDTFGITADYNASGAAGGFDLTGSAGGIKIELNGTKLDGLSYKDQTTTALSSPFDTFGEGGVFVANSTSSNRDLIRTPNVKDTDDNSADFKRNGTATSVTPKATNPTI
jgi:hypothetical protein